MNEYPTPRLYFRVTSIRTLGHVGDSNRCGGDTLLRVSVTHADYSGGRYHAGGCINSKLDWDCLQSFVTEADQNMGQLNLLLEYVAADSEAVRMGLTCHL